MLVVRDVRFAPSRRWTLERASVWLTMAGLHPVSMGTDDDGAIFARFEHPYLQIGDGPLQRVHFGGGVELRIQDER